MQLRKDWRVQRSELTQTLPKATGWGIGVLLIAAAATVISQRWQRASSAAIGAAMLVSISVYALLPLR